MKERTEKEIAMRDYLIHRIDTEIPYVKVNGDRVKRLPNNVNVSFQFIEGESLLLMLDNTESVHPADLHVHQVLLIRLMYFLRSECLMRLHMALCV